MATAGDDPTMSAFMEDSTNKSTFEMDSAAKSGSKSSIDISAIHPPAQQTNPSVSVQGAATNEVLIPV